MRIGGIIDVSTVDIPNKSSMVIFTVGCNLNCEFCHNKYLLTQSAGKDVQISKMIEQIKSNVLANSISITGGEPTLQEDLLLLCQELNRIGKYVSVDTNGTFPNVIKKLLPYIHRIALDLKGSLKKDRVTSITNSDVNIGLIQESFKLINEVNNIDFEIRTTYVEKLMIPNDIHEIIDFLRNNNFHRNFVLQQYQFSEGVGKELKDKFQKPEHATLLNILERYRKLDLPFKIYLRDDKVGYCLFNNLYENSDEL
ncbi:MAG: anaerobic ribonucleoside-triphosphate reductase activating protein [Promethearchaeota archaeon]